MRSLLMIGSTKISTLFPYTTLFRSIRMGVMSTLMVNDQINFNDLKQMLGVTDGNLASHLANLEENGFIKVHKGYIGRKTNTTYSITKAGEKAFKEHIDALEAIIKGVR